MTPSQARRAAEALRLFDTEARVQPDRPATASQRRIIAGGETFPVPATASDEIVAHVAHRLLGVFGSARIERTDPPAPAATARTGAPHPAAATSGTGAVLAALQARRAAANLKEPTR